MSVWVWTVVLLTLSAAPYIASDEAETCSPVENSPTCSCIFPDGTGVDLNLAASVKFVNVDTHSTDGLTSTMNSYFFHPCTDDVLVPDDKVNNTCKDPVAICRHWNEVHFSTNAGNGTFDRIERYESLGYNKQAKFSPTGRSITYGKAPSSTKVILQCAPLAEHDSLVVDEREPNAVELTYVSKHACMKQIVAVSHRSTGSTLLIIFFTLLLFYVVLGVCTKKFLMGAQGLEIIPNLSFWVDLPNLVKEGWVFLVSGCRVPVRGAAGPTATPDPNSYDSI